MYQAEAVNSYIVKKRIKVGLVFKNQLKSTSALVFSSYYRNVPNPDHVDYS